MISLPALDLTQMVPEEKCARDESIPFGKPMIDAAEIAAVTEILSGTQLVHGPAMRRFESLFAERIGCAHAVAMSSCTAGLHLSLLVNGVGPGDEVMVPAMTHVATAHAVEYCGARPVFVDVERETGNLDPSLVVERVTPAMKAIMPVHYLGLPCDMAALGEIARSNDLFLVEDCALAMDAEFDGRKAGTHGLTGCFSFYPVKHLTTAEGGMVATDDGGIADALRRRRAFGYDKALGERTRPGIYDVAELGYNYRMNEIAAAIGVVQLGKLDGFQAARKRNFHIMKEILAGSGGVQVLGGGRGRAQSSYYCLNVVLPEDARLDRDEVIARLGQRGIGCSIHYPSAVPMFAYYREKYGYRRGQFPVAESLAARSISLPVGPHLTANDARRVANAVGDILNANTSTTGIELAS